MERITHEQSLERFHQQIRYVLDHYTAHNLTVEKYKNVVIGGLGGSGIGGKIARLAFYTVYPIPVEVFSEYHLPAYAGKETLVILSSYSGDTEETLNLYSEAKNRDCDIIVLSSGGQLSALATGDGFPLYRAEKGYQPRMALGYSLSTLLLILGELAGLDMSRSLKEVEQMLLNDKSIKSKAEAMFNKFKGTLNNKFVVVCDLAFEAVAVRFCQQIQENAKGESFVSVIPEANHNMIESYYDRHDTNFIILNSGLNLRNNLRIGYLKSIFDQRGNTYYEYPVTGFGLSTIFEVIHATDWLSILVSNAKGADNMQVEIISGLKQFLEQHP